MIRREPLRCTLALASVVVLHLAGCAARAPKRAPASVTSTAGLPSKVSATEVGDPVTCPIRFVELAEKAGLRYSWTVPGSRPLNILQTIGNGCAFLDYDIDGNLDILLVGPKVALYRGDGHGRFTDVTSKAGLDRLSGRFLGCAVGDYDNDGWDDVYISGYRTGLLLHNEGGRRFRDVTANVGLAAQPWGTSCAFADVDEDGFLDLYIANYVDFGPKTKPQFCTDHGVLTACGPRSYQPLKGVLYLNQGGRRFRDATQESGAGAHNGKGLGVAFADYDGSGHMSLAVANDEITSDLFQNRGGGRLRNVASESGMAVNDWGAIYAGMGIDWGDYDNDGRLDLFVTTFQSEPKSLFHNNGNGAFTDKSQNNGIARATLSYLAFGTKFLDADNDGWLDILIANGHVQNNVDVFGKDLHYRQPIQLLHNEGGADPRFADISRTAGLDKLPIIVGRGLAIGDFDNDGRVDALIVDSEGKPVLLHNESRTPKSGWVGFQLIGCPPGNRDAFGAIVAVMAGGRRLVRQCHPGGSYLSSSDPRVHFGLRADRIDRVTVRWPDHRSQVWRDVPQGRYVTLEEGKATPSLSPRARSKTSR